MTLMKQAIADYLIDVILATPALDALRVVIRGALPSGLIPAHLYPFGEVLIATEEEAGELTGPTYQQVYKGLITVSVLLTERPNGDWLEPVGRKATVGSYDQVETLIATLRNTLQAAEHRDLGELTVDDETVVDFYFTGPRLYGLDVDERKNTWENYGSLPFAVVTQRRDA